MRDRTLPPAPISAPEGGYALTMLSRVVLLAVVLAQLVFLGNRYHARSDLTEDQLYSLTASTQKVLAGLEDRLLIECYFTRDDKLPASLQNQRRELRSVLDEYVRRSAGKVDVQFFDPQSDVLLRQKAERLQMQPEVVENVEIGELKQQVIWQGMRLRYGGDRQDVIKQLPLQASTFQYESILTPRIKDLTVKVKPKVKILSRPTQSRSRAPTTYNHIRGVSRYDFSDLDLSEGKLVPDDVAIVLAFRPRDLNDRSKYALDQFLMRGGKLVVFADTDDVEIGSADERGFMVTPVQYDTADSRVKFLEQMASYGVRVEEKVVADFFNTQVGNLASGAQEQLVRVKQTPMGAQGELVYYPYLFHALNVDWGMEQVARQLAQNPVTREVDETRVAQYRAAFKPGLKVDHPLAAQAQFGPGLFWPCPVDLEAKLPDGVTGDVIARTSPLTLVERLGRDVNPFGYPNGDPAVMIEAIKRFTETLTARVGNEPRRQVGLLVALEGAFPSFFAGRDPPPRKPVRMKEVDPLTGKVGKEGEPKPDQPPTEGPPVAEPAGDQADAKDADPPFLNKAASGAQLVVVGDADFLRDDFIAGVYGQPGRAMTVGPVSDIRAHNFFAALLDWLVQDDDLIAIRAKVGSDRSIRLGTHNVMGGETAEAFVLRVSQKANRLQWLNVLGPAGLLLVVWLVVAIRRARRKAAFLAAAG